MKESLLPPKLENNYVKNLDDIKEDFELCLNKHDFDSAEQIIQENNFSKDYTKKLATRFIAKYLNPIQKGTIEDIHKLLSLFSLDKSFLEDENLQVQLIDSFIKTGLMINNKCKFECYQLKELFLYEDLFFKRYKKYVINEFRIGNVPAIKYFAEKYEIPFEIEQDVEVKEAAKELFKRFCNASNGNDTSRVIRLLNNYEIGDDEGFLQEIQEQSIEYLKKICNLDSFASDTEILFFIYQTKLPYDKVSPILKNRLLQQLENNLFDNIGYIDFFKDIGGSSQETDQFQKRLYNVLEQILNRGDQVDEEKLFSIIEIFSFPALEFVKILKETNCSHLFLKNLDKFEFQILELQDKPELVPFINKNDIGKYIENYLERGSVKALNMFMQIIPRNVILLNMYNNSEVYLEKFQTALQRMVDANDWYNADLLLQVMDDYDINFDPKIDGLVRSEIAQIELFEGRDHYPKDINISDEAIKFYVGEGLFSELDRLIPSSKEMLFRLGVEPREFVSFKNNVLYRDLKRNVYTHRKTLFNWVKQYLVVAVHSEMKHQTQVVSDPYNLPAPFGNNIHKFIEDATVKQILFYLSKAIETFDMNGWGDSYGGPAWKKIATIAKEFWAAELDMGRMSLLLDRIFQMQHNTGFVFDKDNNIEFSQDVMQGVLDIKFQSKDFNSLLDKFFSNKVVSSSKVKDEISFYKTAYTLLINSPVRERGGSD